MAESRNQHVVTRHRRWAVGMALAVPLALAVSQSWVAHATAPVQSAFTPITPVRAMDSRATPDLGMHLSPGHETEMWQVTGTSIPTGATAIVLNLTVPVRTATTYLTLWPDGRAKPGTSNLNPLAGKTISTTGRCRLERQPAPSTSSTQPVARTSSWTTSATTPRSLRADRQVRRRDGCHRRHGWKGRHRAHW